MKAALFGALALLLPIDLAPGVEGVEFGPGEVFLGGDGEESKQGIEEEPEEEIEELEAVKLSPREEEELVSTQVQELRAFHREWPETQSCGACSAQLCASHGAAEDKALSESKTAWPKATEQERFTLMRDLAYLANQHNNRSNPALCEFLLETMRTDEYWAVRAQAAYAMGHQPKPMDHFEALQNHMLDCEATLVDQRKQYDALNASRLEDLMKAKLAGSPALGIQNSVDSLRKSFELIPVRTQLNRLQTEWGATLMAIGLCQDPRASKALIQQAKNFDALFLPAGLRRALLESPTQARVLSALAPFKAFDKELKDWDKAIRSTRKEKAPRSPKSFKGTSGQWAAAYRQMQTARINALEDGKDSTSKRRHNLHMSLNKWAEAHALNPVKLRKDKYTAAWKNFYNNNKRSWPKALTPIGAEQ